MTELRERYFTEPCTPEEHRYRVTFVIATEEPYGHPEDVGREVEQAVAIAYGDRCFRVIEHGTEVL